jgi:rare lipoprotein A (peptidoglycan hydrolase)
MNEGKRRLERVGMYALAIISVLLLSASPADARPMDQATATWYGPGFYGNRTACGQRYSIQHRGVAVPSAGRYYLRCGTPVVICRRQTCVRVRVTDTGGFRNHRFDLSARTAMDLCGCGRPYTMQVRWRLA